MQSQSPPHEGAMKKNGSISRCSRLFTCVRKLLNRDLALHSKREVRRAVERVLAGLDVCEGNRDRLACVRLQGAGKLAHLLGDVCIELRLDVGRNVCWIERNVVRATADNRELDAVAGADRDVGGIKTISLRVADHL